MKNKLYLRISTLILTWILLPSIIVAASAVQFVDDGAIQNTIDDSRAALELAENEESVDQIRSQLPDIKNQIEDCIIKTQSSIEVINSDLESLGEFSLGESKDVQDTRDELIIELARSKESNFNCKKSESDLDSLLKLSSDKKGELTTERLYKNSLSMLGSISEFPTNLPKLVQRSTNSLNIETSERSSFNNWLIGLIASALGLGIGLLAQRYSNRWITSKTGPGGKPPYEFNLIDSINTYLPLTLAGLVGFITFINLNLNAAEWNFPSRVFFALFLIGFTSFIFRWLRKENSPGDKLHFLDKNIPKALVKRMSITTVVCVVGLVIFGLKWLIQIPETDLRLPYEITSIALALSLIGILTLAGDFKDLKGRYRFLRAVLILACSISIVAVMTGYINAANYLLFASLATFIAGLILWILLWCLEQSVDGIINGKTKTSYKLRASLGIRAEETSSELGWLRLLTGLGLWASFGLFLLSVWDFTDRAIPQVKLLATDGFQLSENTRFVPKNILIGLMVFAIVLSISIWLKARLERQWLRNLGMDRGSRDAVVTLTGYLGMIIATIMGLTAAGVSFSGLALVAGALSVGIGFGLQNIVNNFISGLILLFERPIHAGDYISVGTVEGTVKRISIRSTEIETLQRTSVIVPNSELISGQVTNWVLHDSFGVIKIPIGVAYGSDTELVKQLLLETTHAHPEVVARPNLQQPLVRFEEFGDSSLNFTIVTLVKNIGKRYDVISDINFAIDEKFREHNIEIPFPQRDLHIRSNASNAETVIPELFKERKGEIEELGSEDDELVK